MEHTGWGFPAGCTLAVRRRAGTPVACQVIFVAQKVIDERGPGIAVTTNGNTLIGVVGHKGEDVVQLVQHASRLGNTADRTCTVELGGDDVVHHTVLFSQYSFLEGTKYNSPSQVTGTDNQNPLFVGLDQDFPGLPFWNTLGDQCDGTGALEFETLRRAAVHTL